MNHGWRDLAATRLAEHEEAVQAASRAAYAARMDQAALRCEEKTNAHHEALLCAEEAAAELRTARDRWTRARPATVRAYKRAGLDVHAHTRVAAGKLRGDLPSSPEALSSTSEQSAKRCQTTPLLVRCGCGWQKIETGCGSADCVDCADKVAARRARRARQRIEVARPALPELGRTPAYAAKQGQPVHYVVLTLPPELRAGYLDPVAWRELGRKAWRMLRRFGFAFAIEATHPVGDKASEAALEGDGDPAVFAPHLNFLAVQRAGFRWTLDLDALRAEWATVLGWRGPHAVQLHVQLFFPGSQREEDKRAWAHATRYALRPFPGWQAWLPSVRWFGRYPHVEYTCTCPHCRTAFAVVAAGDHAAALYFARAAELGIDLHQHGLADLRPVVLSRCEPPPPPEDA